MKRITTKLIQDMIAEAGRTGRRRTNHNIHESAEDPVQRYFIAARSDSYFRPHRHVSRAEFAFVVHGLFDVLVFDGAGTVQDRVSVGPGEDTFAFELPPGVWHAWIAMTEAAAFGEIKQGPYDPATAAEFAPWSPAEGSPEAAGFLARMRRAAIGTRLG